MFVLDTSAVIELLYGSRKGKKIMDLIGNDIVVTTSFTVYEVFLGIKENERKKIEGMFKNIDILNFDDKSAEESANIFNSLKKTGKIINRIDIFIAAICKQYSAILITLDFDFKNVKGLKNYII